MALVRTGDKKKIEIAKYREVFIDRPVYRDKEIIVERIKVIEKIKEVIIPRFIEKIIEVPRYIDKNNISEFLDIGDFFSAKIIGIKQKGIDLTLDYKGLGKLDGGMIIFINPNKVPRVIGRAGSMIKLIKDETNSRITVGQNGLVWIRGDKVEDELLAKKAVMFVAENSFVSGLTDKVQNYLKQEKEKNK